MSEFLSISEIAESLGLWVKVRIYSKSMHVSDQCM